MIARPGDLVVGRWGARFRGRHIPCAVGRGGIRPAEAKREGDGASPAGRWRIVALLWRADRRAAPAARLPRQRIGPADGWCDAPDDPAYNRAVRLPCPASAERLARGDRLYDLVAVTDHNAAGRPHAGSAIFLHAWRAPRHPTAGCVAFAPRDLDWIVARWTPRSRVLICGWR